MTRPSLSQRGGEEEERGVTESSAGGRGGGSQGQLGDAKWNSGASGWQSGAQGPISPVPMAGESAAGTRLCPGRDALSPTDFFFATVAEPINCDRGQVACRAASIPSLALSGKTFGDLCPATSCLSFLPRSLSVSETMH